MTDGSPLSSARTSRSTRLSATSVRVSVCVVVDPSRTHELDALVGLHRSQVRDGVEADVGFGDGGVQAAAQELGVVAGLSQCLPAERQVGAGERALAAMTFLPRQHASARLVVRSDAKSGCDSSCRHGTKRHVGFGCDERGCLRLGTEGRPRRADLVAPERPPTGDCSGQRGVTSRSGNMASYTVRSNVRTRRPWCAACAAMRKSAINRRGRFPDRRWRA